MVSSGLFICIAFIYRRTNSAVCSKRKRNMKLMNFTLCLALRDLFGSDKIDYPTDMDGTLNGVVNLHCYTYLNLYFFLALFTRANLLEKLFLFCMRNVVILLWWNSSLWWKIVFGETKVNPWCTNHPIELFWIFY